MPVSENILKYLLCAIGLFLVLCGVNIVFDGGQIAWINNCGITIVIVTAWVMVDRSAARKRRK